MSTLCYSAEKDSLQYILGKSKDDKTKILLLVQLAEVTNHSNAYEALKYGEEALLLSEKLNDRSGKARSYYHIANSNYIIGKYDSVTVNAVKCIRLCSILKSTSLEADANFIYGRALIQLKQLPEAKNAFLKCKEISEVTQYQCGLSKASKGLGDLQELSGNLNDAIILYESELSYAENCANKYCLGLAYNDLGRVHDILGNYEEALQYYLQGLQISQDNGFTKIEASISGNIGSLNYMLKNYDVSMRYAENSVRLFDQIGDLKGVGGSTSTIASIYRNQGCYEEALSYYMDVLDIRTSMNDQRGLSFVYANLGNIYEYLADKEKALDFYLKCLKIRVELNYKLGIVGISRDIAKLYLKDNQNSLALPYINKSKSIAEEIGALKEVTAANEMLATYYASTGQYQKAFEYQKQYYTGNEIVKTEDSRIQISKLQSKFLDEQNQKKILSQEKKILSLENANNKIKLQRDRLLVISISAIILGLLGFQLYRIRLENKSKKAFADELIVAQEDERKRIASDLHDGIGQSLLLIKRHMEDNVLTTIENQYLINNTLEEVREISQNLYPFQLSKFGLTASIEAAIDRVATKANLFMTSSIDQIDGLLPASKEIHIFRIIQEALNNIVKHANATAAKVSITILDDKLDFKIQDNGVGFDYEMAIVKSKSKSLGLRILNERITTIGGKFKIDHNKPKGTIISFVIPIDNRTLPI